MSSEKDMNGKFFQLYTKCWKVYVYYVTYDKVVNDGNDHYNPFLFSQPPMLLAANAK